MKGNNNVAYNMLEAAKPEILRACDTMIQNIEKMKQSMAAVEWKGESATKFLEAWDEMTVDIAREAKTKLETNMGNLLTKWSTEFEGTEAKIKNQQNQQQA